jgi:hypothetical protein
MDLKKSTKPQPIEEVLIQMLRDKGDVTELCALAELCVRSKFSDQTLGRIIHELSRAANYVQSANNPEIASRRLREMTAKHLSLCRDILKRRRKTLRLSSQ